MGSFKWPGKSHHQTEPIPPEGRMSTIGDSRDEYTFFDHRQAELITQHERLNREYKEILSKMIESHRKFTIKTDTMTRQDYIEAIRKGEYAIENDDSNHIADLLMESFPEDSVVASYKLATAKFYFMSNSDKNLWTHSDNNPLSKSIKATELMNMKTEERKITPEQAQRIIDVACNIWKEKLSNHWAIPIVLKQDIEIHPAFYDVMRSACTAEQHTLFDEIFGVDKPDFKVGDFVVPYNLKPQQTFEIKEVSHGFNHIESIGRADIRCVASVRSTNLRHATEDEIRKAKFYPDGTPCWVKSFNSTEWQLRYSAGNGEFYMHQLKSGRSSAWEQHKPFDPNNLPFNE